MKYCISDEDTLRVNTELSNEAMDIAWKLSQGADYGQFDIDPFEAGFLIMIVQDFAKENQNETLLNSCNKAIDDLRIFLDAFAVIVESEV